MQDVGLRVGLLECGCPAPSAPLAGTLPRTQRRASRKPVRTAHFLCRAVGQVPTWRNESQGKSQAASQESPCKAPRRQAHRLMLAK